MMVHEWFGDLYSEGKPLQVGEWTLTPASRSFVIQLPGMPGGLVWNRPAYVLISQPGVREQILPVRDQTRLVLLAIALGALVSVLLARALIRKE